MKKLLLAALILMMPVIQYAQFYPPTFTKDTLVFTHLKLTDIVKGKERVIFDGERESKVFKDKYSDIYTLDFGGYGKFGEWYGGLHDEISVSANNNFKELNTKRLSIYQHKDRDTNAVFFEDNGKRYTLYTTKYLMIGDVRLGEKAGAKYVKAAILKSPAIKYDPKTIFNDYLESSVSYFIDDSANVYASVHIKGYIDFDSVKAKSISFRDKEVVVFLENGIFIFSDNATGYSDKPYKETSVLEQKEGGTDFHYFLTSNDGYILNPKPYKKSIWE